MFFDKNQREFPSDFCTEVWWWAVGIVPVEVSLTEAVKSQCDEDTLLGCHQWHDFFEVLCEDMYTRAERYAPASPRQYRDILEYIAANGAIQGDAVIMAAEDFEEYRRKKDKSAAYVASGVKTDECIAALAHTGLVCEYEDGAVVFINPQYPKLFHAMTVFERSPNREKTPARHHFAHCEFRQLFKSYSPNYDELLRRVSDESRHVAREIDVFAKSLKIQRYVHFGIIKYKYKNIRVLDYSIRGDEYPTLRVNICSQGSEKIRINAFSKDLGDICDLMIKRKEYIEANSAGT